MLAAEIQGHELHRSLSESTLRKRAHTVPQAPQPKPPNARKSSTAAGNKSQQGATSHLQSAFVPSHLPVPKEKLRRRLSISALFSPMTTAHFQTMSFKDYLRLELTSANDGGFTEEKTEQLLNVIKVPGYMERVILFGVLACLDSFLYTFTILPMRFCYASYQMLKKGGRSLTPSKRGDVSKGVIFFIISAILLRIDTSKIYHGIRGQAAIKLYVMFSVFEIADKLCSALGQDIMECLYSSNTLNRPRRFMFFAALGIVYCSVHSVILLYQIVTLNVAVNSYSNALLTLLLSNQFAEIKSAVFKKFERENLFQLTCADITERFQLIVMLLAIGLRNVVEVSTIGIVPTSWSGWNRWMGAMFGPALVVVGSEVLVDWLKHAYVAKFNNIRPQVYHKFLDVLAIDYSENAFSDQIMTKRIGLPVYPLAAVFVRMIIQSYTIFAETAASGSSNIPASQTNLASAASPSARTALEKVDDFLRANVSTPAYFSMNFAVISGVTFVLLLFAKLMVGSFLYAYATKRYASVRHRRQHRKSQDESSDFVPGREKGFGTVELDDNMRRRLYDADEEIPTWRERPQKPAAPMDYWNVTRFKMVAKRIW